MASSERDKVIRLEAQVDHIVGRIDELQTEIHDRLVRIEDNQKEMNIKFAKAGGIILALAAVGGFASWIGTQAVKWDSIFGS